jgi:hypothetical protein
MRTNIRLLINKYVLKLAAIYGFVTQTSEFVWIKFSRKQSKKINIFNINIVVFCKTNTHTHTHTHTGRIASESSCCSSCWDLQGVCLYVSSHSRRSSLTRSGVRMGALYKCAVRMRYSGSMPAFSHDLWSDSFIGFPERPVGCWAKF